MFRLIFGALVLLVFSMNLQAQTGDFDLALRIFPADETPVEPGDIAEFTIEVINQGDIDAQNIKLVNYIPEGLQFVTAGNTGWNSIGDLAITTITGVLAAGDTVERTLFLQLTADAEPENIINIAEISLVQYTDGSDASNDDIDSTPDTDPANDEGAGAFSITDDSVNLPNSLDEDDHDVALLIICTPNVCNNFVNISLNAECSIEILADMVVENPSYPDGAYTVVLEDEDGNELPSNMVDGSHIGQTLKVTAFIEGCEGSGCWSYATIEDKFAINLFCSVDTVDCGSEDPESVGLPLAPGTSYYPSGDDFIIPGPNGCSDVTLSYEDEIEMLPCQFGSPYVIKISREFTAVDGLGNSTSCTSEIYVRKGDLMDIVAPADITMNPLECGTYPTLPDGNPSTSVTGEPEGTSCPNIIAVFEDLQVSDPNACDADFTILREWTIIDWCSSDDTTFTQTIKVRDLIDPTCNSPQEFEGYSYVNECEGEVQIVDPNVTDNCSETSYTIMYKEWTPFNNDFNDLLDDNIIGTSGDYRIEDLSVGRYRVAYFVEDDCGNTSQCLGTFRIIDNQDPTPVCVTGLDVTLDQFGGFTLPASDFDFASFDNCGIDKVEVRRLNGECGSNLFSSTVNFCCEDAGTTAMVQLRITDFQGNSNICMVPVEVTDDINPTITCPADVTLMCSEYYGLLNENLSVTQFGSPSDNDNCPLDVHYYDTKAFNECGVGIVVRTWTAEDGSGNMTECKQFFEIESDFDFDEDMISWPADITLNQCVNDEVSLMVGGEPVLPNEACSSFTVTFDDVVNENGAGCGDIERTFTVVDNCALDEYNNSFSYTQKINVFENEDPEFVNCIDTIFVGNINTCETNINHTVNAVDNCTDESDLIYSYSVDLDNDGTIDLEDVPGNNINGTFPVGTHRAVFRALDECGNEGTCAFLFTSMEDKNPTPICIPLSVSLEDDGTVTVWANDFNHKSFDNCTDEEDLTFSFSENINNTSETFDCFDIPNGVSGIVEVTMYVWDQSGNFDFCTTTLTLTDTDDICDDAGSLTVDLGGKIMTSMDNEDFPKVDVNISNGANFETFETSDVSGNYMFSELSLYDNYTIKPEKNDDALNGITTSDIVRIQKHILGLVPLTSMEHIIAADVNHDEKISGSDIIQMRKLLLGFYANDEFPQNTSWRFYPNNFDWNENYPYEFPEEVTAENVLMSNEEIMFYGIKIGDLNNTADISGLLEAQTRNGDVILNAHLSVTEENTISIPVKISESITAQGFQIALDLNADIDEITIKSGALTLNEESYNIEDNQIFIAWYDLAGAELVEGEVIFTIEAYAQSGIKTEDVVLGDRFEAELYSIEDETFGIDWNVFEESVVSLTDITVNSLRSYPNPFDQFTTLDFHAETSGEYNISIFNLNGSEILNNNITLASGNQSIRIDESMIQTSGIYYVYIKGNKEISVAKIIKM